MATNPHPARNPARLLFVLTVLTGSFLLFLVQPLVARMALPLLGGAPNVWNSAMLVYQALLLGGYAYAHGLSRFAPRKQAMIHIGLLLCAALTLPIAMADLPAPPPGWEPLWVPALLMATIGPLFFLVSAQAPLMQRWFAAEPSAGDPYWLYAASNIGSFAGLISYPLLFEPALPLAGQSLFWAAGYGVLIVLVILAARSRWNSAVTLPDTAALSGAEQSVTKTGWLTILFWLALSAVPSGLMLSTTTHLTTDIVAMPLLWVVPLGLYLLSFVFAFNENSRFAAIISRVAPIVLLAAGGLAMVSRGSGSMTGALAAVIMLFVVAVALHRRLFAVRPDPQHLTFFYLVMSAGGALGGVFTALIAPVVFDWVWEHPLLVIAAAALLTQRPMVSWLTRFAPAHHRTIRLAVLIVAVVLSYFLYIAYLGNAGLTVLLLSAGLILCGAAVLGARWAFVSVLLLLMLGRGGYDTIHTSLQGDRSRSYFGVYTVANVPTENSRGLLHGTTLHGKQRMGAARWREPTTYYGRNSGIGLALDAAPDLYGPKARIGIVGLGVGTLACYHREGQDWAFFEIDPMVEDIARKSGFTFLSGCTPDAPVHIGDARLVLADMPPAGFDVLAIDAFSSDAIPLHLLTREALDVYARAMARDGVLMIHISNRFIDLRPVLAAHARERGWQAMIRQDGGVPEQSLTASRWVAMSSDAAVLDRLRAQPGAAQWDDLPAPAAKSWTDDHASILPYIMWDNFLRSKP